MWVILYDVQDDPSEIVAGFSDGMAAASAVDLLKKKANEHGIVVYSGSNYRVNHLRVEYLPEWEDRLVGV